MLQYSPGFTAGVFLCQKAIAFLDSPLLEPSNAGWHRATIWQVAHANARSIAHEHAAIPPSVFTEEKGLSFWLATIWRGLDAEHQPQSDSYKSPHAASQVAKSENPGCG